MSAAPVAFDIPAQAAPAALDLFIKQSSAQVVYLKDEVAGVRTNAVAGSHEPRTALELLLKDTGLTGSERKPGQFAVGRPTAATGSVRGTLIGPDGKPAEGVTVRVKESPSSVFTDRNGDYLLTEVSAGQHTLVATAAGYQPLHITGVKVRGSREVIIGRQLLRRLSPTDDTTRMEPFVVEADSVTEMDPFEVSGDKVKPFTDANVDLPRTINDPKPYYVFTGEAVATSGAVNLEEFFSKKLTMISNFNSGLRQTGGTTPGAIGTAGSVALRGLSSAQTLILMNGRRLPAVISGSTQNSPDINSIPLAIIDRIEVLPSSGSGIYGGSALGGVINIITKRNYTGGEIRLTYDNTFSTDTAKRSVALTYGFTLEGGRTQVMVSASWADAHSMMIQDRYGLIRGNYDRVAANNPTFFTGSNTLAGTTPRVDSSAATVPLVLKAAYGGQTLTSSFVFMPAGYRGVAADGANGLAARAGQLDPNWPETIQGYHGLKYQIYNTPKTGSIFAEVRRQMFPSLEMFLDFSYDQNSMRTPNGGFPTFGTISIPASAPTNPFNQTVTVRYPISAAYTVGSTQSRRRAVGGFQLKLPHDWQVLADYSAARSMSKSLSGSLALANIFSDAAAGALDVFADPARSPTIFDRYFGSNLGHFSDTLLQASVRGAGPLPKVLGLQPMLIAGSLFQWDSRSPSVSSTTNVNYPALNTSSGTLGTSQDTASYFGELTLPLVASDKARFGLKLLDLQVAARLDKFTAGLRRVKGTSATSFTAAEIPASDEYKTKYDKFTPTYGLRYKPVDDLMFRVSFANGFLPPTPSQLVPGIPSTTATNITDPRRGNTSVAIIANPVGGNPNLIPETSDNWSAGVVITPTFLPGLRLAVDYTFIKKANNITTLSAQNIVNNEAVLPGRVTRAAPVAGDPFGVGVITGIDTTALNLLSTSLEAYDLSLNYRQPTARFGTFTFDALATIMGHYTQRITLGAPTLEYVGTPSSGGPLKLRGNASFTWSYHAWETGWAATYYDSYLVSAAPFTTSTLNVLGNGGRRVSSQITHDVFVRYRFGQEGREVKWRRLLERTELLVGVRNLFNRAPSFDGSTGNISSFFLSPYGDARLASYYLSLKRIF